jgi:protein SCO1/2
MGMRRPILLPALLLLLLASAAAAQQRYPVSGLILNVDRPHQIMLVSCQEIRGYMEAMAMPFKVADPKSLDGLTPGTTIQFTLVVTRDASVAEDVRVIRYASAEREPSNSRRLQALDEALRPHPPRITAGQPVPDFILTDQRKKQIRLSDFKGKVIALNFVYTRCALPDYCFRLTNNFGALQKRYKDRLGQDLVLMTVTFDPTHDQPETLSEYARTWKADPENWRFLTGAAADVQRVCDLFGVNYVPDEGLFVHSLHTAVIGRDGKLVVNLEGNEFTAQQLGDLVETVLDRNQ